MDKIDRLMLITARIGLGVLFLESLVSLFVRWVNPFLDEHGLPRLFAPLWQVILLIVCSWFLRITFCRVVLAISAGILLLVSVVADLVAMAHLHAVAVRFGDSMFLISLMEGLYLFGLFSLLWVSFRPPAAQQMLPGYFLIRHARA